MLFLDLDDFKLINDSLGHSAGDQLLLRVAERLTGATRTGDTAARLGGDEFAVLIEDDGDPVALASRIVDVLRTPFVVDGETVDVRASIGVFELGPDDAPTTADQLLIHADTAMYAAKRSGKDRVVLYRNGMSLAEFEDGELARALRAALDNGELQLEYQPIVDLATGEATAVEALARWTHDGEIDPSLRLHPDGRALRGDGGVDGVCARAAGAASSAPGTPSSDIAGSAWRSMCRRPRSPRPCS